MNGCPLCGEGRQPSVSVVRERLPVYQNVVWNSAKEARAAPTAGFALGTCKNCGFSRNIAFDSSRIDYDENYDNGVPSTTFRNYYQSLIDMLAPEAGIVYDIGCGKGEFLQMLCAYAPNVRGIGIDPSCQPVERGNFQLIRSTFKPSHFDSDTTLVVCRHVLEHIGEPVDFLTMLRESVPDVPVFIEVPELGWILRNGAFWDFCYEHCNYFTPGTLKGALEAAGFAVEQQQVSFGGQYQWALCRPANPSKPRIADAACAITETTSYSSRESEQIERLSFLAEERGGVVLWGMATKGVVLSALLPEGSVVGGVDVNRGKQGKFAAVSGVEIHPPEWLRSIPSQTPVLVMNPNYFAEISAQVDELQADVELLRV